MTRSQHRDYLASLPDNWPTERLGSLGRVVGGGTPSRAVPRYWGGDIPWLTPGELANGGEKQIWSSADTITHAGLAASGAVMVPEQSLLVTTRATLGRSALAGRPIATNQGFKNLVFGPGSSPDFYFHLTERLKDEITRRASGTTFLEISGSQFAEIEVPAPPLAEQQRIAKILDTVNEAITAAERVVAKLLGERDGVESDLIDLGLGPLTTGPASPPEGWAVGRLGDFIHLQRGFDITESRQRPGHVPVVSSGGVFSYHDTWMAREPGVVVGRKGKLGGVYYLDVAYWPHDTTLWVTSFGGHLPRYIAAMLKRLRLERLDAATSVPTLNRNFVHPLLVAMPPLDEQQRIVHVLASVDDRIKAEEERLRKLRSLRAGLATDLLTGRVRTVPG